MRRILGSMFQSLDGVVQAPGGPDEDTSGGFRYGGWIPPFADAVTDRTMGEFLAGRYDLLLGRRTYDIFAGYWPHAPEHGPDGGIAGAFNRATKYVLTRNPDHPLDWAESHRLADVDAVAALKRSDGPDLIVQGSSTIYPALLAAGLIDRLMTLTYPVLLGHGKRLFGDGTPGRTLRLVDHRVSPNGVIVARYEPVGDVVTGSFA